LVGSQVLGGGGVCSGIAVGGLLAEQVSASTSLAGLAQTGTVLGAALLALPLARAAEAAGRRPALAAGYGLGLAGAVLAVVAGVASSFPLLLAAMLLFGGGTASGLQARYAATDAATAATRGRALSVVVWATTLGAVAGPNLAGVGGRFGASVGVPSLAGPFLFSVAAFAAAAAVVLLLLRPDPLPAARGTGSGAGSGGGSARARPAGAARPRLAETLRVVAALPRARLGICAVAAAHAVMVGVMVMTPVHLGHAGASLQVVGVVISLHVAGMYAASPLMGWLSDRAGRVPTIGVGVATLAAALGVAAAADAGQHGLVGVALTLLGLGWSACLVAGSTLLTESVPDRVRTSVQGVSDLAMGLAAALAGALAGPMLAAGGYRFLALAAGGLLVPVVLLAASARRGDTVGVVRGA
jgi:MFS family permease